MRFRNIDNWEDADRDRGLLFFAQRVYEATFRYTVDSYKAPTMSAPGLVREALDLVDALIEAEREAKAAWHVLDEMEARLRGNVVVSEMLSSGLENYLGYDRNNLESLRRHLSVLRSELSFEAYMLKIVQLVNGLIGSDKKKLLNFLASEFASVLSNNGVDREHVNTHAAYHFFGTEPVAGAGSLSEFVKGIYPHAHDYEVHLLVSDGIDLIPAECLDFLNISVLSKSEVARKRNVHSGFRNAPSDAKFVAVSGVKAADYAFAVSQAKEKVILASSIFRLFCHKVGVQVLGLGIAEQKCCTGVLQEIDTQANPMHSISDRRPQQAGVQTVRFMREVKLNQGPDMERFFTLLSFQ